MIDQQSEIVLFLTRSVPTKQRPHLRCPENRPLTMPTCRNRGRDTRKLIMVVLIAVSVAVELQTFPQFRLAALVTVFKILAFQVPPTFRSPSLCNGPRPFLPYSPPSANVKMRRGCAYTELGRWACALIRHRALPGRSLGSSGSRCSDATMPRGPLG